MTNEEINIRDLLKSIIELIADDTISFDIDHELPPYITAYDCLTLKDGWNYKKLDMNYTNYKLKFSVVGAKQGAEMDSLLGKLYKILRQIKEEL